MGRILLAWLLGASMFFSSFGAMPFSLTPTCASAWTVTVRKAGLTPIPPSAMPTVGASQSPIPSVSVLPSSSDIATVSTLPALTITASPMADAILSPASAVTPTPTVASTQSPKAMKSPAAAATLKPTTTSTETSTVSPSPVPCVYQKGEITELQKILNLSQYLGVGASANEVMTGVLDDATAEAIRRYLATLNGDPQWQRNYLTRQEYRQLLSFSAATPPAATIPTPSPSPTPAPTPMITATASPVLTPEPRAIVITSPTLPPESDVLSIPQPLSAGLTIRGLAEPGSDIDLALASAGHTPVRQAAQCDATGAFEAAFSKENCAAFDGASGTTVTVSYPNLSGQTSAILPIDYRTAREGNAALVSIAYSRRNAELLIRGVVNPAGIPILLQDAAVDVIAGAIADSDGQFFIRLKNAMVADQPATSQYLLILNGDDQRPVIIRPDNVTQETLLPVTRSLQTREVALIGIGLLTLGLAMLTACLISRRRRAVKKPNHRSVQGGDPHDSDHP